MNRSKNVKDKVSTDISPLPDFAAVVWPPEFSVLEGKILTLIEASVDKDKQNAVKSIARNTLWDWYQKTPKAESKGADSPIFELVEHSENY